MDPIRVLCVDDNATVRSALTWLLNHTPDLTCAGTLESADNLVERVKEGGIDIILLDIRMPGADPFTSLTQLKSTGTSARTIILSGDTSDADRFLRAGAIGCLDKGAEPDEIIAAIRYAAGASLDEQPAPRPSRWARDDELAPHHAERSRSHSTR